MPLSAGCRIYVWSIACTSLARCTHKVYITLYSYASTMRVHIITIYLTNLSSKVLKFTYCKSNHSKILVEYLKTHPYRTHCVHESLWMTVYSMTFMTAFISGAFFIQTNSSKYQHINLSSMLKSHSCSTVLYTNVPTFQ